MYRREAGREREEEEGVGKEDGVMLSACSLGNLSNLESCQDTARLCNALPLPFPCESPLVHERTRGRKTMR